MLFQIVSNFTRLTARETTYNNFEISLAGFMPNITTNHAITYAFTNQSLAHENYLKVSGMYKIHAKL